MNPAEKPSQDARGIKIEILVALLVVWAPWALAGLFQFLESGSTSSLPPHLDWKSTFWELWGFCVPIALPLFLISRSGKGAYGFGLGSMPLRAGISWTLVLFFLMTVFVFSGYWTKTGSFRVPGFPPHQPHGLIAWLQTPSQGMILVVMLTGIAALAGAFAEELFYRGYLLTRMTELGGSRFLAVFAASLLFAVPHLYQGSAALFEKAVGGAIYSLAVLLCGRIWPGVIVHGLMNLWLSL